MFIDMTVKIEAHFLRKIYFEYFMKIQNRYQNSMTFSGGLSIVEFNIE